VGPTHKNVLFDLIDQAYAAAEAPRLWEKFLVSLAVCVNGRGAALIQHAAPENGTISIAVRVASEAPGSCPVHDDLTHLLTAAIDAHPGSDAVLTVLRGECDAPFGLVDRRLFAAVVPHVREALRIHGQISDAEHEHQVGTEALEALRCAVFLVTADARIVMANRRAHALLAAADGLRVERSRLAATDAGAAARLRNLCAAVAATPLRLSRHPGGALALPRRAAERPPLHAVVAPAPSGECLGLNGERVAAIVFVSDPLEPRAVSETLLQEAYGLTPAESQVAARIAVGRNLEAIAAERGSALETVRRQNKQVLAKTGARHRCELVRLLTTLAPLVGR
jgi:DNA-binding CsgD family transcriptional regulator